MIYLNQEKEKIFSKKKIPDYYFNTHFENPEKEAPQKRSLFLVSQEISPKFLMKQNAPRTLILYRKYLRNFIKKAPAAAQRLPLYPKQGLLAILSGNRQRCEDRCCSEESDFGLCNFVKIFKKLCNLINDARDFLAQSTNLG